MFAPPAPFDNASTGAWTEHGKRKLTFAATEPGTIARNSYLRLHAEVSEREPWKGEPLWCRTERNVGGGSSWVRSSLPDKGHEAVRALLVPAVALYGFDRAWQEAYARRAAVADQGNRWEVERARAETEWWRLFSDLAQMMADGVLDFQPCAPATTRQEVTDRRLEVLAAYGQRSTYEEKAAVASLDGEVVGFMTNEGHLVPPDDLLRRGAKPPPQPQTEAR